MIPCSGKSNSAGLRAGQFAGRIETTMSTAPDPPQPDEVEPKPAADESEAAPEEETRELTAEEQMEQYEEALKEEDWGHQPC